MKKNVFGARRFYLHDAVAGALGALNARISGWSDLNRGSFRGFVAD